MSRMRLNSVLMILCAMVLPTACDEMDTETDTAEEWTVSESVYVNASPDRVWEAVGDYYAIHNWHPGITATERGEDTDTNIRILVLGDGGRIHEELLSDSDSDRMYAYRILEAPLPVVDYVAEFSVSPEDSGSRVTWSSRFDVDGDEKEIQGVVRGVFSGGLNAIAQSFNP